MKKIIMNVLCIVVIFMACISVNVNIYATNTDSNIGQNTIVTNKSENISETGATITLQDKKGLEQLLETKDQAKKKLEDYKVKYGSDAYGMAAYVLNAIRIYSIPFCFVGIAIGAVYQYVIGIRKLDERDKGFTMIIGFVSLLVIAQILPLIFAIVVKGWRG